MERVAPVKAPLFFYIRWAYGELVSECHMESYPQARAVNSGDISVGQAPYIIDAQAFQKVVDAGADFHVRTAMHRSGKRFGREKQQGMLATTSRSFSFFSSGT